MSKASKAEREQLKADAIDGLKRLGVKPGSRIYATVTHVSKSGMSRHVRCFLPTMYTYTDANGKKRREQTITDITGYVANACGYKRANGSKWDIVIGGYGTDVRFLVVYRLGQVMFPKGGPIAHSARVNTRSAGKVETDGGYLLKSEGL